MILVTGGLGFIGPKLARHFLDMGKEVLVTVHRNLQPPQFSCPLFG